MERWGFGLPNENNSPVLLTDEKAKVGKVRERHRGLSIKPGRSCGVRGLLRIAFRDCR